MSIYTIPAEGAIDSVAAGDAFPVYDTSTGLIKKASASQMRTFMEAGTGTSTITNLTVTGNSVIGNAITDTVGFYGVTPVAQPAGAGQAALTAIATTTISQVATSGKWGFATSTAALALVNRVGDAVTFCNKVRTDLVALGLWKGAA